MAPFAPFLAETLYKQVGGNLESVHLEDWPVADQALIDEKVLEEMGRTRSIVSKALERRSDAGINVRQVLRGMTVTVPTGEFALEYQELAKDEVNVKSIDVKKGSMRLSSISLLRQSWSAREPCGDHSSCERPA